MAPVLRLPAVRAWSSPGLALGVALLLGGSTLLLLRDAEPGLDVPAATVAAGNPSTPGADRSEPQRPEPSPAAKALDSREGEAGVAPDPSPLVAAATGTVRDPTGAPIRGASPAVVEFVDHAGRRRTTDAGPEGGYELRDLATGTHWVTARADGYRSVQEQVELRFDAPVLQKDFTLQPAVVLRIVVTTPEGGALPLAHLLVPVATQQPPGPRLEVVVGSGETRGGVGSFRGHPAGATPPVPGSIGILQLDDELPVHVSLLHDGLVLQTQRIDRGQDEVTFALSPVAVDPATASIRALVIDAGTGQPIVGARLVLLGGARSHPGVATDVRGVAIIERHQPGRFDLHVVANGYARFRQTVDALPGAAADLGTVALAPEATIAGRVLGTGDRPIAAAFELGIVDPADQSIRWLRHEPWQSGGDGVFALRGIGPGSFVIRTRNHDASEHGDWEGVPWVSGNVPVDTRSGPVTDLEIRLHQATRLVLHVGGATNGLQFRVVDARGMVLVADRLRGPAPRPLHLPAGSYRVQLLDAQGALLAENRTTLGASTVHVDLVRPAAR